jgi:protein-tyrosine phosphatase
MVVNVLDMPHENLMRHFKSAVDFIKSAIRSGGTVLVHWLVFNVYKDL